MPDAFLFDVSRSISRIGKGLATGIDRVELAYFRACLETNAELFSLARIAQGYALLDRRQSEQLLEKLLGNRPWGGRNLSALRTIRQPVERQQAESDLRRMAMEVVRKSELGKLTSHIPARAVYVNVGQTNAVAEMEGLLDSCPGMRRLYFLHDLIPIEWPQFTRPDTTERFARFAKTVSEKADVVICNSDATAAAFSRHGGAQKPIAKTVVAHLGIEGGFRAGAVGPTDIGKDPYFVALGTIEPRKNIKFLLDIWRDLATELPPEALPKLYVVGRRGWMNEDVFAKLDANDPQKTGVFETGSLPDGEVVGLLRGARALLFPSFVEGYGLPPLEAAALGTPVICGENAISPEILGTYPLYLSLDDPYLWKKTIIERAGGQQEPLSIRQKRAKSVSVPSWDGHFRTVFSQL